LLIYDNAMSFRKMENRLLPWQGPWVPMLFALLLVLAPVYAQQAHYLPPGEPDVVALLPPPPLPDSPEQAADMAVVRSVCRAAPSNEVAMATAEKKFSILNFAPAIGDFFQPGKFPKTESLLQRVQTEAAAVTDNAKEHWKRPRPFMVDPTLASGKLEKTFSYPSGHSTESMVLALVLADLFPVRRDAILAEARGIGWHRVEIARHYPTDIYAGRVLAQAIVVEMKKSAEFQKDFAGAKAEIAAGQPATDK
jgi:acid phosphatase (class A)